MKHLLLFVIICSSMLAYAQPTQTVRGKVIDDETQFPLYRAKVEIFTADTTVRYRALTNLDGDFSISNVPVGKHELVATFSMYDNRVTTIEVTSGREVIIDVPMKESFVEHEEVVIVGRKKGEVINELAYISAQQFSVSETDRYAGSRGDPARMASNFAGVGGADDSRNDIVIRGNSPLGVVWKVEGVDIPNPSHFAISGSTGGPVSILNNKILANSDFLMSAFPAEYGNSTSGVFDLKLRNGNNKKHEFTGQFGFLGTEMLAEGPMNKKGTASYLIMGRYSTLDLFKSLGISVGTDAIPKYGDGAIKMNWRLKKSGSISFFAIGGGSDISIKISDQTEAAEELYGEGDRDQYFGTAMSVAGLTIKKPLNEKTFIKSTIAYSLESQRANHDFLVRSLDSSGAIQIDSKYALMGYRFTIGKGSGVFTINHKLNKLHLIKAGINLDHFTFNMLDSALNPGHTVASHDDFAVRWDYTGGAFLAQPFVQWKWRMTENMDFTAGIHSQYFNIGGNSSLSPAEPRVGWRLKLGSNQSVFAGAGMHSQIQPLYTYMYHQFDSLGNKEYHNLDMDFSRSIHYGAGYQISFKNSLNFKTEVYYQSLYNIPVTVAPSSFSLINMGSGFARFFPEPLQNTGTGYNYGAEFTLQKFFDKSFFFLLTGTVYNSRYVASDGIERNTSYNGMYIANIVAGKEFKLGAKHSLSVGLKITAAGGKRYGYVDVPASEYLNELVYMDSLFNERQFKDYFRTDLKINWRMNAKNVTHEIGLDLVNVTGLFGTENLLGLTYAPNLADPTADPFQEQTQLGFLPLFYYKIDFHFERKSKE